VRKVIYIIGGADGETYPGFRDRMLDFAGSLADRCNPRSLRITLTTKAPPGFSLIPLKIYFKNGKAKVLIAVAKGKRSFDKRESIKRRDAKRELDRARKDNRDR